MGRARIPSRPSHASPHGSDCGRKIGGAAAVALHALRGCAARIVAARYRCDIANAEDHVADAVFVMVYGIRCAPGLRIPATTTPLAYLCGVARNEWRWERWRRAREAGMQSGAVRISGCASGPVASRRWRTKRWTLA